MTTAEIQAIARSAVPPVGMTGVMAVIDHEPGLRVGEKDGHPGKEFTGEGGSTHYGVAWQIDGRKIGPTIALFDRQRDAFSLIEALAGGRPRTRERACAQCGEPLPIDSRADRLTCSDDCRQAFSRSSRAERMRRERSHR